MVLLGDIAKAFLACFIGLLIGAVMSPPYDVESVSLLAAGAGVVVGHNWPVYFGFKGGKGALTAASVMIIANWQLTLLSFLLFIILVFWTRFVSLGTISAVVLFAFLSFFPVFDTTIYFKVFASILATIIVVKHRENISRLSSGVENKLSFRKK